MSDGDDGDGNENEKKFIIFILMKWKINPKSKKNEMKI